MENDFNANNGLNDQSHESDGDSITIDNNDYEEYSDEFQIEENAVEDKKEENEPIKEKKPNPKSQKNKSSQQIQKNKKSRDMRTENNENMSQEEDEPLKAELQEKLNKVFLNYSKFNVQEENFILSHQYFMKLMKDCGLLREKYEKPRENTLTAEQIDITLKKVCPNNASLNTQQFIDFFVTLSKRLNPLDFNKAPRNTVQQTVEHFLDPIVEYINEDQEGKFRYNKVEQSVLATCSEGVDEKTEKIMKRMYPGLLNAYKLYFPQEYNYKGISIEKIIKESLKSLIEFNIDFDLSKFLTREKLAIYYNCIYLLKQKNLVFNSGENDAEEEGKIFTFDKFAFYLLCLANDIIPEDQFPKQWQKVSLLIKCLSDSNGEETMSKKFGVKITDDKGIYLDDHLIKELIKEEEEAKRLQKEKESPDGVLSDDEKSIIEKIFLSHANKDKMTQGKITITPYFNILKDLGIFEIEKENGELVNRKDAEMALTQVSRKKNVELKPNGTYRNHNSLEKNTKKVISKLDFDMFITSLQELSLRIYPSLKKNQAFEKLMHEQINISGLEINSDYEKIIEIYNDIIQREENENDFSDILNEFKPIFKEIFDNYKDMHKDTISWQNYLIFCKDFNIISNNLNITNSNTIFNGLSKKYTKEKGIVDTGLIDFNYFFYSIAIFSFQANNDDDEENNLISLFLAMLPSAGIQKPRDTGKGMYITYQNKFREKLRELKKIYPSYFNNGEPDEIKLTSFNKIFSS
jgi:hypothetical protein